MLNVLIWLITIEAIGLAVLPLCYYLFPKLHDRGYSVSKPLGLLLIGYTSWVLSVLHILPSTQLTIAALLVVLGALSGWYLWPRRKEFLEFVVRERVAIGVGEAVFLAVFFGWVAFRAYDPAINHTEQPMDFAFLNASIRTYLGTPEDPWLRGESISYYYFGYWIMGALSKLTAIPSNFSYNLSLALVPAMAALGIFGLVYNMVRADSKRLRHALVAGAAAALLLTVAANLEGVLEFMRANHMGSPGFWKGVGVDGLDGPAPTLVESWRPQENWWWWRATRVIGTFQGGELVDYTIHEFPFFSFMLGDLHPHVMSLPFVTLFLALCWNLFRSPAYIWSRANARAYLTIAAMGLSLGGLAFTNMWDLPVFSAVLLGLLALKTYSTGGERAWDLVKGTLPLGLAVIGVAVILFLPYYVTFTSQVSGIAASSANITRSLHLFIVWGLFLVAVTPFVMGSFWMTTVREDWGRLTVVSLLVGFVPYVVWAFLYLNGGGATSQLMPRLFHVLPVALLVSIGTYSALWWAKDKSSDKGKVFALGLSTLGLLLIMGPELLYVNDSFGGAHERMNTVFKLYYQAWIVLAVASGFAIYYWSSLRESATGWTRRLTQVWSVVFVVLLAAALYYPPAAAASKGDPGTGATLDGLDYVGRFTDAEYRAIQEIKQRAGRDSAVLEAVGDDYTPFGRISASTGVPTVLGWKGHEVQWRGSDEPFRGREDDVAAIYQTDDVEEAQTLLAKYRVDYVYVGPRERDVYGVEGLDKFRLFMETVFDQGGVTVYRLPP